MAKLSEKYEAVAVFSVKNGEEQIKALTAKFSELISSNGELVKTDEWGKRRMAYPINYENDGYYVVYTFTSKPDFPAEFERVVNITDGVLRFLAVLLPVESAKSKARTLAQAQSQDKLQDKSQSQAQTESNEA